MDNTLTRSKSPIAPEHIPILKALCERADVVVVSGHGDDKIDEHLSSDLHGLYYMLGQNGNQAVTRDGTVLWEHKLSDTQKQAAYDFAAKVRAHMPIVVKDDNDLLEDRGCQIAFSLIGHHEDKEKKEAFDPDHQIREKLLREMAADVEELVRGGIEVRSAGTTNFDMFAVGKNKGYNIHAFIEHMQWEAQDCLYIGDALYPGGNDETVIGTIPTHAVKDYRETYEYLAGILKI